MLPVIVSGRRSTCWKCGQTSYMATSCSRGPANQLPTKVPEISNVPAKTSVPTAPLPTIGEGNWKVVGKRKRKAKSAARLSAKQEVMVATPARAPRTDRPPSNEVTQHVKELMADLERQLVQPKPAPPMETALRTTPKKTSQQKLT